MELKREEDEGFHHFVEKTGEDVALESSIESKTCQPIGLDSTS